MAARRSKARAFTVRATRRECTACARVQHFRATCSKQSARSQRRGPASARRAGRVSTGGRRRGQISSAELSTDKEGDSLARSGPGDGVARRRTADPTPRLRDRDDATPYPFLPPAGIFFTIQAAGRHVRRASPRPPPAPRPAPPPPGPILRNAERKTGRFH